MFWAIIIGALLIVTVAAIVIAVRSGGKGEPEALEAPAESRRSSRREPSRRPRPVRPDAALVDNEAINAAVERQMEQAGRLVAGHVQLIDMHALLEEAPADSDIDLGKALAIAERVVREEVRASDTVVVMKPDGVAILFDGLSQEEAGSRSREIAQRVIEALGHQGGGDRFLAEGFAYELDEVLEGAAINSVDDLIRFVRIAHQSYVNKQRGLAAQLRRGLELRWHPILDADRETVFGIIVRVFELNQSSGLATAKDDQIDAATASEIDCVVLEKLRLLAPAVQRRHGQVPIYLPMHLSGMVNPLYLDNVVQAMQALGPPVMSMLCPVLRVPSQSLRRAMPTVVKHLKPKVRSVGVQIEDPRSEMDGIGDTGVATAVLDNPARFRDPVRDVEIFLNLAKKEFLLPVVLSADPVIRKIDEPFAHSRDE